MNLAKHIFFNGNVVFLLGVLADEVPDVLHARHLTSLVVVHKVEYLVQVVLNAPVDVLFSKSSLFIF